MEKKEDNLKIEQGLKLLAKSSIIVFVGVFLSKLLAYAYRVIIARQFGPEIYGLFSLATMIVSWFIAVSSLGLAEGIVRYISLYRGEKNLEKIKHIQNFSVKLSFFLGILAGVLLFLSANFISIRIFNNSDLIIFLKLLSIIIPIALLSKIYLSTIRAFEQISAYSFILNILQNTLLLLSLILFIFLGLNKSNTIILSYSSGFLIALIASYLFCKYKLLEIFGKYYLKRNIKKEITFDILSYSWPLMFLSMLVSIFYWVDSFCIGYFKGVESVGFYNAATPIVALLSLAPDLFMQLFFPLITKEYSKKNSVIIKELSKQISKWIFIINLPLFLIIFIFPGAIINILFGQKYLVAEKALRILVVGGFLTTFTPLSTNLLSMTGRSKLILSNFAIMTAINVILNIIFIPKYGITGAAFATAVSWVVLSVIYLLETRYFINFIPVKKVIVKIFIVSLIPAILVFYMRQFVQISFYTLALLGLTFFLVYMLLIFITGCLDENDWMIIKAIKLKLLKKPR